MDLAMKQKAYIKGNKNFLGTITLESGERFNFIGGQRFLYLLLPFLQWVMLVYCWKESDDVNQDSNIIWPLVLLLVCLGPLTRNWGAGFPSPFYIPPVLSLGIALAVGIVFIKYMTHKFKVPQNVTLYKIQIHLGITGVVILLLDLLFLLIEVGAMWLTFAMPYDFSGPYLLVLFTSFYFYLNNIAALNLRKCSVEFLGKVKN
ncbi:hypothetical protein ACLHIM_03465 [Ligilactobacillus sp. LYQ112]|uniref:hypothetical protein n=1 Tax=Ligilactobacillus sp. LYQ112 TaxID=3391060 RepID=UPI003983B903